jgi:hypothetical protein
MFSSTAWTSIQSSNFVFIGAFCVFLLQRGNWKSVNCRHTPVIQWAWGGGLNTKLWREFMTAALLQNLHIVLLEKNYKLISILFIY